MIWATMVAILTIHQVKCSSYAQDYDGYEEDYADYQEYAGDYGQEDKLYYNYAQRQESKK
jgi:hypothetical protein